MEVRFSCGACRAPAAVAVGDAEVAHRCASCGAVAALRFSESLRARGVADRCAVCGGEHFYIQKDFDQRVGCVVIAIGAALTPWTYGLSLAVCAAIDFLLYRALPDVAKCYVCKATYRGGERNPAHQPFDLHLLEKYEAEARRSAREGTAGDGDAAERGS
jgi:predicted RNA-binding Zn-ribbon protein involved in translation (DUF1610 family)